MSLSYRKDKVIIMTCTWKDCNEEATYPQFDNKAKVWADLCEKHHVELDKSIGGDPKVMLRAWVLASGGAKKMVHGKE
jgi:hypothetical protein